LVLFFSPGGRTMRLAVRALSVFCLGALLALPLMADDAKKDKKPDKKPQPVKYAKVFSFDKIKLDDAQKAKLEELRKEFTPKLDVLAAKKGKELQEAISAALKLNEEEQAQMKAINQEQNKLNREINQKKLALLTEEQKEQLKPKKDKKKEEK
jgi:Spy/CpxP family protein refolding chaperone